MNEQAEQASRSAAETDTGTSGAQVGSPQSSGGSAARSGGISVVAEEVDGAGSFVAATDDLSEKSEDEEYMARVSESMSFLERCALKTALKTEFTNVRRGALVQIVQQHSQLSVPSVEGAMETLVNAHDRLVDVLSDLVSECGRKGEAAKQQKFLVEAEQIEERFSAAMDKLVEVMLELPGEEYELESDPEQQSEARWRTNRWARRSRQQVPATGFGEAEEMDEYDERGQDAATDNATRPRTTVSPGTVTTTVTPVFTSVNQVSAATNQSSSARVSQAPLNGASQLISISPAVNAAPVSAVSAALVSGVQPSSSAWPAVSRSHMQVPASVTAGSLGVSRGFPYSAQPFQPMPASAGTTGPVSRGPNRTQRLVPHSTSTRPHHVNVPGPTPAQPLAQSQNVMNIVPTPLAQAGPWTQMSKIGIPVFEGDKRKFESWNAAFLACVDAAPTAPETKMLQLRQYLRGEPLEAVEKFGYSSSAYDAAKALLVRKYGGKRRQIAIHLEELDSLRPVRSGRPKELERFVDLLTVAVINIKDAGRSAELMPGTFYSRLLKKLDQPLVAQYHRWRYDRQQDESVEVLLEWSGLEVEFQITAAEAVDGLSAVSAGPRWRQSAPPAKPHTFVAARQEPGPRNESLSVHSCPSCKGRHSIWKCLAFKALGVAKRWQVAKDNGLCYRCLGVGHTGRGCPRSQPCGVKECKLLHHRLLHRDGQRTQNPLPQDAVAHKPGGKQDDSKTEKATLTTGGSAIISMRVIPVMLTAGDKQVCVNALLDDASTDSYITERAADELGLVGNTRSLTVSVLNGGTETFTTTPVTMGLSSVAGDVSTTLDAYTTDRIITSQRAADWHGNQEWPHLRGITFPRIEKPRQIDALLGINCAELQVSLKEVCGRPGEPIARLTPLGWTAVGPVSRTSTRNDYPATHLAVVQHGSETADHQLAGLVKQFWEIESSLTDDQSVVLTPDEKQALDLVAGSLQYQDGRYRVGLPWKQRPQRLPESYAMAMRRLSCTEKRLQRSPECAESYGAIIKNYLSKGYIRKVDKLPDGECWYLPHFPVLRPDKATTKVRIVFDAAAKSGGVALNDLVHKGPKLQRSLSAILVRFRQQPVAIACDIAEMYLQIELAAADRRYHRFLWRDLDTDAEPQVYEFNRVVFGVNASPFLAQYVSQEHAKKNMRQWPLAAEVVGKSTYMDDSMTSAADDDTGRAVRQEVAEMWKSAGMHARKWLSNSSAVLQDVSQDDRAQQLDLEGELPSIKTLGVLWNAAADEFSFSYSAPVADEISNMTKRKFLKKLATIFDPLGIVAPFTVKAKTLFQQMWMEGYGWDDPIAQHRIEECRQWFQELADLSTVKVTRSLCLPKETPVDTQLHVFADASQEAYGACAYLRHVYGSGAISSRLVAAKTHVAPLTAHSIPRLELMAAMDALQLSQSLIAALRLPMTIVYFWTDAADVLFWIHGSSRRYKPFVANRVGRIHGATDPAQWRHVPSKENPADLLSRGLTATQLSQSGQWWHGPEFLLQDSDSWPVGTGQSLTTDEAKKETRSKAEKSRVTMPEVYLTSSAVDSLCPERYSSYERLLRVRAWVSRFVENSRQLRENRTAGPLTPTEISEAEKDVIRDMQVEEFAAEVKALKSGINVPATSKIANLCPFLDEESLLRCNSRLSLASHLPHETCRPIVLPKRNWVTKLIIKQAHESHHHSAGTNQILAALSVRFWIISAREAIRMFEATCPTCKRQKAKPAEQVMAPVPSHRITPSLRAFETVAVDYAGPFETKQGRRRSRMKRYMCLFTCTATRAVHIEMAYDLSTNSFLNAFERFTSRRGPPQRMISDNGTNFVGADRELRELVETIDTDAVKDRTSYIGIEWSFNPPAAPHFGGIHESLVKSAKRAIRAVLKDAAVTDEELVTCFTGVEGILNSRPLTYQTSHPSDDVPLTPNHFLHGQAGGSFAPPATDSTGYNPQRRWRQLQDLLKQIWKRWMREWLPMLHPRAKWRREQRDMKKGDIVIVVSPDTPRSKWPLARVLEVYPGQDSHVRVAKVLLNGKNLTRPISKLCPLLESP